MQKSLSELRQGDRVHRYFYQVAAMELYVVKVTETGHWDIDELLNLMEWTRHHMGPNGLVIILDTSIPKFATENFASHVVKNMVKLYGPDDP